MDERNGIELKVPASIYYTADGTVNISIKFNDVDDSALAAMLQGKTMDESKSVVNVYTREILDKYTLPKACIWFSGSFHFTDSQSYVPPEEIAKQVMETLALKLRESNDDTCKYCANKDKCSSAAAEHGDGWQTPDKDVCAKHIIKYFWDKCKTR